MNKPVLLIDNFDSFTYMLADYIRQTGERCEVMRNNEEALLQVNPKDYLAMVISPGPQTPLDAGFLMQVLPVFLNSIPVLGICLGQQAIGIHYGAKLGRAKTPRHGKVDQHTHNGNILFEGVPDTFQATRYHSLILFDLPLILKSICFCEEEIMGLVHEVLPVWGVQFHPESCQTDKGLQMVKNFLRQAKKIAQI